MCVCVSSKEVTDSIMKILNQCIVCCACMRVCMRAYITINLACMFVCISIYFFSEGVCVNHNLMFIKLLAL